LTAFSASSRSILAATLSARKITRVASQPTPPNTRASPTTFSDVTPLAAHEISHAEAPATNGNATDGAQSSSLAILDRKPFKFGFSSWKRVIELARSLLVPRRNDPWFRGKTANQVSVRNLANAKSYSRLSRYVAGNSSHALLWNPRRLEIL